MRGVRQGDDGDGKCARERRARTEAMADIESGHGHSDRERYCMSLGEGGDDRAREGMTRKVRVQHVDKVNAGAD
jgi:hypothetical protein